MLISKALPSPVQQQAQDIEDAHMDGSDNLIWANGTNNPSLTSAGVWTDASDASIKRDVDDLKYGLETINKLKPRSYHMRNHETDDDPQIGFVAQEIKEIIPECVSGEEGRMGIGYGRLNAVLVKAVQELSQKIDHLEQSKSQPVA